MKVPVFFNCKLLLNFSWIEFNKTLLFVKGECSHEDIGTNINLYISLN